MKGLNSSLLLSITLNPHFGHASQSVRVKEHDGWLTILMLGCLHLGQTQLSAFIYNLRAYIKNTVLFVNNKMRINNNA